MKTATVEKGDKLNEIGPTVASGKGYLHILSENLSVTAGNSKKTHQLIHCHLPVTKVSAKNEGDQ